MMFRRWPGFLGLAFLALAFGGCGKKIVKIHGTILKDGKPMVVNETTYVTLQFNLDVTDPQEKTSRNAKFQQLSGTYTVELPAGKYRTMLVVALPDPANKGAMLPPTSVQFEKVHDLTKDQELTIEVPAK